MDERAASKTEARAKGLGTYYTGLPCKNGHTTDRRTSNGQCLECLKNWHANNKARHKANTQRHYQANKEIYKEKARTWGKDNPEKLRELQNNWRRSEKGQAQSREWYADNKEIHNSRTKDWKQRNPGKVLEHTRARQAGLKQATPVWADRAAMQAIYEACPEDKWVDHIIPLQGKTVCGLHVDYNLQYLTPEENMSKGNKIEIDSIDIPIVYY